MSLEKPQQKIGDGHSPLHSLVGRQVVVVHYLCPDVTGEKVCHIGTLLPLDPHREGFSIRWRDSMGGVTTDVAFADCVSIMPSLVSDENPRFFK